MIGTHSLLAECFSIGLEQRDEVEAGVGRAWYGRAFADLMKRGPRTLLESRMIVPELLAHIFTDPECVLQFQHDLCAREDTFAAAKINFESSLYAPDIEEP